MTFQTFVADTVAFVREHEAWAPLIVFVLAFAESFAFISLLVPAWGILIGVGALVGASGLEFWPVWLGAAAGASLGDWISYLIGYYLRDRAAHVWPLSRHPEMVARGHAFFERWGAWGIFIGRFFGPLRAVVPLVAGVFAMSQFLFQMANVASAMVWAFVLLAPGAAMLHRFLPA
ncbi:DedA family protein [Chelatococcus sp. SYSU_G07232]|uniref:DedA family protein n=1 Tax=Chelatococcus albus TaxID=3047466 RepID=A0ABT7AHU7_9HYPH|nr:DedA family protein [Chelatococcus sp. SYSU_G07232]MDJ1158557.1 DedA family protein [Chelatococcus sp. SYSU_G07232]